MEIILFVLNGWMCYVVGDYNTKVYYMARFFLYTYEINMIYKYDIYRVVDSVGHVYFRAESRRPNMPAHIAETEAKLKIALKRHVVMPEIWKQRKK